MKNYAHNLAWSTENFNVQSVVSNPLTLTVGNLVFSQDARNTEINVANNFSGNSLYFNRNIFSGVQYAQFQSVNPAADFRLNSLKIDSVGGLLGAVTSFKIEGFDGGSNGTLVASVDLVNFLLPGTYGSGNNAVTLSSIPLLGTGGTLSFGSAWDRIDTVRFTKVGILDLSIEMDDINLSDALVPVPTTVTSSAVDGAYKKDDVIPVNVMFDRPVLVTGTPRLEMNSGGVASYVSGSGTNTLTFNYMVGEGESSAELDYLSENALDMVSGLIQDGNLNNVLATLPVVGGINSLAGQKDIAVDGVIPAIVAAISLTNGLYGQGQFIDFIINYDKPVMVNTSGGTPSLMLTLDTGGSVSANYLAGSGTSNLVFRYTVSGGNEDNNGIDVNSSIHLNGGSITDVVGNNATLVANDLGVITNVLVDAVVPSVTSIIRSDNSPTNADVVNYLVNFSEPITGADASDFILSSTGTASGFIADVNAVGSNSYYVTVNSLTGDGDVRLDLKNAGTGILDAAGNLIDSGLIPAQLIFLTIRHPLWPLSRA